VNRTPTSCLSKSFLFDKNILVKKTENAFLLNLVMQISLFDDEAKPSPNLGCAVPDKTGTDNKR
jgi:hypothetical protein